MKKYSFWRTLLCGVLAILGLIVLVSPSASASMGPDNRQQAIRDHRSTLVKPQTEEFQKASERALEGRHRGGRAVAALSAPSAQVAISHSLVVKNTGSKSFFICDHWGYSNGATEGTSCLQSSSYGPTRYGILQEDKWSDRVYSWGYDVDGIEVPAGYRLKEEIPGPNRVQFLCHKVTRWHKISPTISDHHREFYLNKC